MLRRFIPRFLAQAFRDSIDRIAGRTYYQSYPGATSYCIHSSIRVRSLNSSIGLPIPPPDLRLGVNNPDEYLRSGANDIAAMLAILQASDFAIHRGQKILEFGCCTGRMIRHLAEPAHGLQLWGVDLHADYIQWCRQNLTPEIHFAVSTAIPHLPFPDEMFDLIFCGSVFTHIEDFDGTWLLELSRILRPGGFLYFTIHDEHSVQLLNTSLRDSPFAARMLSDPVYQANSGDFSLIAVGRKDLTQVFYHSEYFKAVLPPMLEWISLTHEAYGLQSAVLVKKLLPSR